ncbi:MAG: hypothetical protein ABI345_06645 [Jatrophihabitans sp.]
MQAAELEDGDVAILAGQAVDLLAEDIDVRVDPVTSADPYRWGGSQAGEWVVWPLVDGHRSFGIDVTADLTPPQALAHLLEGLSNDASETRRFWGVAFPACPGHPHQAEIAEEADEVVLRCPKSGKEIRRIRPALPA